MDSIIVNHFAAVDPVMSSLYGRYASAIQPSLARHTTNYLFDLCESIVSQQLSVKAASTIFARASAVVSDWNSYECILAASTDELRKAGLSHAKIRYIQNLAQHIKDARLPIESLDALDNESVISLLCEVKGIGRWTAEMFLMFSMARQDVFSYGDQGLKNAIQMQYHMPAHCGEMKAIIESWSPYRTVASKVLWKSLDNEPLAS